jgi:hypothetical protein
MECIYCGTKYFEKPYSFMMTYSEARAMAYAKEFPIENAEPPK